MLKLSIITINLNNIDGLQKTMQSVVSQTFQDMEWIVIDGASNDGSRELIEKNTDRISHWISEKDDGIYQAMNKGIRLAKGEYLLFLNSGDFLTENTIIEQVFKENKVIADLCFGHTWFIKDDYKAPMGMPPANFTFYQFIAGSLPHSGGTFYRRQLFLDYGLYDEKYYMCGDIDFNLRVIFKHRCTVQKTELFISYFDGNGISQNPSRDIHWEHFYMINKYFPRIYGSDFKSFGNSKDRSHALRIWDSIHTHWYMLIPYKLFLRPLLNLYSRYNTK